MFRKIIPFTPLRTNNYIKQIRIKDVVSGKVDKYPENTRNVVVLHQFQKLGAV